MFKNYWTNKTSSELYNVSIQQSHTVERIPQVCVIIAKKEKKCNSSKMTYSFKKNMASLWEL